MSAAIGEFTASEPGSATGLTAGAGTGGAGAAGGGTGGGVFTAFGLSATGTTTGDGFGIGGTEFSTTGAGEDFAISFTTGCAGLSVAFDLNNRNPPANRTTPVTMIGILRPSLEGRGSGFCST